MLFGILMGGLAFIGLSMVTSLWQFYICYIFSALAYMCGGPLPNQVLISRWFDKARGKAMGIVYLGIGVGGMLVPQIARWLNTNFGWHQALMLLGFLIIAIAFPITWFVRDNPASTPQQIKPKEQDIPIGKILRSWPLYLLVIGSMCSIGAVSGTSQNLKLFFSLDLKFTQEHAANIISLVLASSLIGRLLMGWLADRFPKKYVMILIYSLVASAIPLLFFAEIPGVLYLFTFVFGLGLGGDYMIIPLMAADLFGVRVLGRVMGIIITFDGFSEAFSPMLVGWLRDRGETYAAGFSALIILAVIGTIAVSMLPRKTKRT
jgi:sugar phosphate permease